MEARYEHGMVWINIPNRDIADKTKQLRWQPNLVRAGCTLTSGARNNAMSMVHVLLQFDPALRLPNLHLLEVPIQVAQDDPGSPRAENQILSDREQQIFWQGSSIWER